MSLLCKPLTEYFRRAAYFAVGVGAFLLLAGCAVKRPPSTPQLVKDALPATTTIPDTWSNKGTLQSPVVKGWIKSFQDPQLEVLVDEALKNNLDLKAAATRINVAEDMITEAHSQMLPFIGVSGAAFYVGRYNQTTPRGKPWGRYNASSLLAGTAWELDLWGMIRSEIAAATQEFQATEADYLYAQESLAAVTAKAWFLSVYTKLLIDYADQNVSYRKQALELVETQQKVGQVQGQQVVVAEAELETAQSQAAELRRSLQQVVRGLEILLGRYPADELKVASSLATMPPVVPAGLPFQLLERRPDILAAEHTVDATFHLIQTAQAARLPSLSLTGAAGYLTNEIYQKLAFRPWIWTVGANLAAPLYTGGFLAAQVNVAKENERAALMTYGQAILRAFDEVEADLDNERYLREEQKDLQAVLSNVDQALGLERFKYQVGQVDLSPVLQLEESELGAQAATAQIEFQLLANRVNLQLALGGSF